MGSALSKSAAAGTGCTAKREALNSPATAFSALEGDGGWAKAVPHSSASNTTALAIMAPDNKSQHCAKARRLQRSDLMLLVQVQCQVFSLLHPRVLSSTTGPTTTVASSKCGAEVGAWIYSLGRCKK